MTALKLQNRGKKGPTFIWGLGVKSGRSEGSKKSKVESGKWKVKCEEKFMRQLG